MEREMRPNETVGRGCGLGGAGARRAPVQRFVEVAAVSFPFRRRQLSADPHLPPANPGTARGAVRVPERARPISAHPLSTGNSSAILLLVHILTLRCRRVQSAVVDACPPSARKSLSGVPWLVPALSFRLHMQVVCFAHAMRCVRVCVCVRCLFVSLVRNQQLERPLRLGRCCFVILCTYCGWTVQL